jgi:hypothetical protein
LQSSFSRRADVVRNRKFRIAFITWSDHIDLEIVFEQQPGESYFTREKANLTGRPAPTRLVQGDTHDDR